MGIRQFGEFPRNCNQVYNVNRKLKSDKTRTTLSSTDPLLQVITKAKEDQQGRVERDNSHTSEITLKFKIIERFLPVSTTELNKHFTRMASLTPAPEKKIFLQNMKSAVELMYNYTMGYSGKLDVPEPSKETTLEVKKFIGELKTKIKNMKKLINEYENEAKWDLNEEELIKTKLAKIKSENDQLERRAKDLEVKLEEVERELGETKKELGAVKTRLTEVERKLALGQVAWIFEQEVAKYVLPESERGKIKLIGAYGNMENWLAKNIGTSEGTAAKERLDKLQKKVNWSETNHKEALKLLKELRKDISHPPDVDLQEAKRLIPEFISDWKQKECIDIILIIEEIRQPIE